MPRKGQTNEQSEEYKKRQEALRRYQVGEKPAAIYRSLERGKTWFYKWVGRHHHPERNPKVGEDALQGLSRRPDHQPQRTPLEMEQAIVRSRDALVARKTAETRYSPIGAKSIQWELLRLGYKEEELPAERTVNGILRRYDKVTPKSGRRKGSGKAYPKIAVTGSNQLHQFDLVGPRYVRGEQGTEVFHSANVIDAYCRSVCLRQYPNKTSETLCRFLVEGCFRALGIPQVVQMDNLSPVTPQAFAPHCFGPFLRLCLFLDVEVRFIPLAEPWRNGIVERFNDDFEAFYREQSYRDLAHLQAEAEIFERFRNTRYPHGALKVKEHGSRLPQEVRAHKGFQPRLLPEGFSLEDFRVKRGKRKGRLYIPLQKGRIHCVRFVRSDLRVNLFGEVFSVPQSYCYEYVVATIDVAADELQIRHQDHLIQCEKYEITRDKD